MVSLKRSINPHFYTDFPRVSLAKPELVSLRKRPLVTLRKEA